jgi:hypothetical protein
MHAPPAPFIPPELQGAPIVTVLAAYWGDVDTGAETLAPLTQLTPAVDLMGPTMGVARAAGVNCMEERFDGCSRPARLCSACSRAARLVVARSAEPRQLREEIYAFSAQRRFFVWLTGLRSSAVWMARPEYLRAWIELQRASGLRGTRKRGTCRD